MVTISPKARAKLKAFIAELASHRGRHTELISVYVPAGYDLTKIIGHLAQEQGTAANIKSAATRKNVIAALEKLIGHLRLYPRTPPNGLAAFCGNVSTVEGVVDLRVWSIDPPLPLSTRIYRCDKAFVLEPLAEMLEPKELYALVVMDRREANIALLRGKRIEPLISTHSHVPGKFRAGGQSARRFEQLRELAAKDFYKKIAEYMKEQLLGRPELKGIIVGGPGPTKYEFIEGGFIVTELARKIIAIKDLAYTGEFGLHELIEKAKDVLAAEEVAHEKAVMARFFELLARKPGMVAYGIDEVRKALDARQVEQLLLSDKLERALRSELEASGEANDAEIVPISTETREGIQLAEMGGVAAILRYEVAGR
mgnify:CR=1 FL=1